MEVGPVPLPVAPPGDCNHYGWPVATLVEGTIIVMHRRIPGHTGPSRAGWTNEKHSYGIVLRSEDGGRTWSKPYDLRMCMKPLDRYRGGLVPLSHRYKFDPENKSKQGYPIHLYAIATTRDGAVVAINNHGVFRSEDEGRTWRHFSQALREDTFPREIFSVGPRMIDHPKQGLLAFGNWFGPAGKPTINRKKLVVLKSADGGATWTDDEYDVGISQFAPAGLLHGDRFLFVTRHERSEDPKCHAQMTWTPGQNPEGTRSNLNPGLGPVALVAIDGQDGVHLLPVERATLHLIHGGNGLRQVHQLHVVEPCLTYGPAPPAEQQVDQQPVAVAGLEGALQSRPVLIPVDGRCLTLTLQLVEIQLGAVA